MSAATAVLVLIVLFAVVFGVRNFAKHMATGCCGGGDVPRRNRVKDRNRDHYPYAATLAIGGMSCRNCAVHVENALNSLDGVWAKVDLDANRATVLMKSQLGDAQLTSPVAAAGYTVRGIERP